MTNQTTLGFKRQIRPFSGLYLDIGPKIGTLSEALIVNIFGWKIGVSKTTGQFYHSMSYQDHHPGFVIELPKQLTNALNVH